MTRAVAREDLDVFFSPSVYTYFPLPPRLRAVVTIHDAIAERFPELTLPRARARAFWWAKVRVALMQARRVLTVSEYAARDVERVHGVPRERIDIAVEAPSSGFKPRDEAMILAEAKNVGLAEGERWFVYVGGFNPHKNVPSIIRAHAAVVRQTASNPPHLLLVGTVDSDVFHGELPVIRTAIEAAGTNSLVHWTGFLPDERLSALHSGSIALVLPSSAEGFGLPAVEAAACGSPVIATNESPLPDLLSESGIFVTPGNDRELEEAMLVLLGDSAARGRMAASALRQSGELSWKRAARAALASLTAAAA
jgi:alpha-1,3-rhamnosyl/mannosyltransferase